jgi:outer membrane protein assembly factor BamB
VPVAGGDWTVFGFDAARSNVNPGETTLTPATVARLHRVLQVALPGVADSSPALLSAVRLADGTTRAVLYVTTQDGRLLALDAVSGAILWSKQPAGPKITQSSPAIDPSQQYVYAYGLDGFVHKYRATTGDEIVGGGWPVPVTRMPNTEKQGSALNIADGYLYVTTGGYLGDAPPYQGHVVTIRLSDASVHIFNSLCSTVTHLLVASDCPRSDSGIWARGGAVVDPLTGDIFVTTGNGAFDANTGGPDYGDSVIELSGDGTRVLDSYTPSNYQVLDDTDGDLGSDAPALLPTLAGSATPYLLLQGGKDGMLRLVNRRNMSGRGAPGGVGGEVQALSVPGCDTFTQPTVWQDAAGGAIWVVVAATCGLRAYQLQSVGGKAQLVERWRAAAVSSTVILAGGVLYAATSGALLALDPQTGTQLWSSAEAGAGGSIGAIHWQSPIVIAGRVYCADESGQLTGYGL